MLAPLHPGVGGTKRSVSVNLYRFLPLRYYSLFSGAVSEKRSFGFAKKAPSKALGKRQELHKKKRGERVRQKVRGGNGKEKAHGRKSRKGGERKKSGKRKTLHSIIQGYIGYLSKSSPSSFSPPLFASPSPFSSSPHRQAQRKIEILYDTEKNKKNPFPHKTFSLRILPGRWRHRRRRGSREARPPKRSPTPSRSRI